MPDQGHKRVQPSATFRSLRPRRSSSEATALEPAVSWRVAREAAEVLIYLVHLPDVLGVDLVEEAMVTARRNEKRFPMDAKEHE